MVILPRRRLLPPCRERPPSPEPQGSVLLPVTGGGARTPGFRSGLHWGRVIIAHVGQLAPARSACLRARRPRHRSACAHWSPVCRRGPRCSPPPASSKRAGNADLAYRLQQHQRGVELQPEIKRSKLGRAFKRCARGFTGLFALAHEALDNNRPAGSGWSFSIRLSASNGFIAAA